MILLDLFSGIGGFAKGFEMTGFTFEHHYFSEIDKHAIANYKYNFKDAKYAGNIITLSGTELKQRHPNEKFIITFGFPCQDLSVAGKGAGFDGERSVLFFQAIRIIQEINPEVFIFENVKGLLSHNGGKTFEVVLRTIADIGLYECEWQLINTRWILPQNRERVFFVGHLREKSRVRIFPITETDFRVNERESKTTIVRAITAGGHSGGYHSGMSLICDSGQGRKLEEREIFPPIRSNTGAGHGNYIMQINNKQNFSKSTKQNDRIYDTNGIMASLNTESKCNIKNNDEPIRRLTEIECERLQGFPDYWTKFGDYDGTIKEICKTQRYKMLGNAITASLFAVIAQKLN